MPIIPISRDYPACFGVVCELHQRCARYAQVNHSQADPNTIVTCMTDHGYPLFQERVAEEVAA